MILVTPAGQFIAKFGSLAFFLHAMHWPTNQFVKLGLAQILPTGGDALLLVNYVATAFLTIVGVILMAKLLNRLWPALYGVLSGGRSRPRPLPWTTAPQGAD